MNISKAKLGKGGSLEVSYTDDDGNDVTVKGHDAVHPDLKAALAAITPHFADITDQREATMIDWGDPCGEKNADLLANLTVTGVQLKQGPDDQQCLLVGRRYLTNGNVMVISAPLTSLMGAADYARYRELRSAIMSFFREAELYFTENKKSGAQQEIAFGEDPFGKLDVKELATSANQQN